MRFYAKAKIFYENEHRVIVGRMELFANKECPTYYLMFNRKENFICVKQRNKDIFFYRCLCCIVLFFLKMFQGGNRTIYSPSKMDFTKSMPTKYLPQTTTRPRTSVRRNLIHDFKNELPTPIVTNTPLVQEIFANRENCTEAEPESSRYSGLIYWTCGISAFVLTVLNVFCCSPQKLLLRFTHEAQGNITIILLGIIACAVLLKLYQSTKKRTSRIPIKMQNI